MQVNNVGNNKEKDATKEDSSIQTKILYSQVFDIESLKAGYERTRHNVADISEQRLANLAKDLRRQTYKPKPNKRVAIPKPDGGVRYLGIASAIDKVVQGTILNLLEPLAEKRFYENSFGFRPGKGCHSALHKIKYG
jgi:retron-type reverse transcriptase